jgi:hypothetical protein
MRKNYDLRSWYVKKKLDSHDNSVISLLKSNSFYVNTDMIDKSFY